MYMNRCGTPDQVWRHVLPGTYWALVNLHFNQGWKLNLIMFIQHLMDFQTLLKKKITATEKKARERVGKGWLQRKQKLNLASFGWLLCNLILSKFVVAVMCEELQLETWDSVSEICESLICMWSKHTFRKLTLYQQWAMKTERMKEINGERGQRRMNKQKTWNLNLTD